MPDDSKIKEFPSLSSKLAAPTKKSIFERQREEAEAKRVRDQAETAAVYEDFVKSFDEGGDAAPPSSTIGKTGGSGQGLGGPRGGGASGPSRRHFTTGGSGRGLNSGPGSLGPVPQPMNRKRPFEDAQPFKRERDHGMFAFENSGPTASSIDAASAFRTSDDEDEKTIDSKAQDRAVAKPTIHLSSLPPTTSPAVIKSLIPTLLSVDNIRILPSLGTQNSTSTERRSLSAIVTLAKDTPATDIDTVVNSLQNKYLGYGFYLAISRHLSSAAVSAGVPVTSALASTTSMPFGARPIPQAGGLNRAPPSNHRGGYAPPSSYGPSYGRAASGVQVTVKPPNDLKQLKLIHKTLEVLLTYGPEFEALLMSRPAVQREEKWAWLWDPRSSGGVWYRWRLWDILTDSQQKYSKRGYDRDSTLSQQVFDGGASWVADRKALKFEYTTHLNEFVSDPEYDSSDEEDDETADRHRPYTSGAPPPESTMLDVNADGTGYLTPLAKAKLTHLLARLPTTNAKLRKGDVARITAFAIEHAGSGADEVVEMIISNMINPFAYTAVSSDYRRDAEDSENDRMTSKEKLDTSASKLIGLYVASDILSSAASAGVRYAYRYRSLFDTVLRRQGVFSHLGRIEKELSWGRMKAEKWKRSIVSVLHLWEGSNVFPQASHDHFVEMFERPPLTAKEQEAEKAKAEAEKDKRTTEKTKSKWKAVDEAGAGAAGEGGGFPRSLETGEGVDAEMEDVDGLPMDDNDDNDQEEDMGDLDGEPMEDSSDEDIGEEQGPGEADVTKKEAEQGPPPKPSEQQQQQQRSRRPEAVDMFADTDDEE